MEINRKDLLENISTEVNMAKAKYPKFNSNHEGYAVILEELDELWGEIKRGKGTRCTSAMQRECIQVAAMAIRFIEDLQP